MSGRRFSIFFRFTLKPTSFYLFINALDLVVQNFSVKPIDYAYTARKYEITMFLVLGILNFSLLGIAIAAMVYYILYRDYRSTLHQSYVWVRFFIVALKLCTYIAMLAFYMNSARKDSLMWEPAWFNLVALTLWIFFEVFNFLWSFGFKRLIIEMTNEDDVSQTSLIDPQQQKQLENEQDVFSSDVSEEEGADNTGDEEKRISKRRNKGRSKRSRSRKTHEENLKLTVPDMDEPKISNKDNLLSKVHDSKVKKGSKRKDSVRKQNPKKGGTYVESEEDISITNDRRNQPRRRPKADTIQGNSDDIIEIVSETINDEESKYEV